jgi:hypothetical protein
MKGLRATLPCLRYVPCLFYLALAACTAAQPPPRPPEPLQSERVARAQEQLEGDPTVQARVEAVKDARAREDQPMLVDEVEIRVGQDYVDEHEIRVTARVPLNRPSELRARRDVLRAETRMAISRLEETSLERRSELCFPAVEALAAEARGEIYREYARRQRELLDWNADWLGSGMINELAGARFELESRIKLATWEPAPVELPAGPAFALPEIGAGPGVLRQAPELVRDTVRNHHPSVALRRATADRYRALAARARARNQPWIKFVDLGYEYRSDKNESGVRAQLAFEIPLGSRLTDAGRYEALIRERHGESEGQVEQQIARSLQALSEIQEFEARTDRWQQLEGLAAGAEEIAARWWRGRLAKPSEVAALLDEAFAARSAILDARERAGSASCTLLAMTGVSLERWPRQPFPGRASDTPADPNATD